MVPTPDDRPISILPRAAALSIVATPALAVTPGRGTGRWLALAAAAYASVTTGRSTVRAAAPPAA